MGNIVAERAYSRIVVRTNPLSYQIWKPVNVNLRPNVELEMLFIDDLLEEMYDVMEGHPHT